MQEPDPTRSQRLMVLMFTDLVGSTHLKERIGDEAYGAMLGRHEELLKQALGAAGSGRILQNTGDGYFLAFDSARRAVAAALLFQWLMAKEPWPHPFATRVGLHLGEVDEGVSRANGQPKFVGSAIDLASRVMSLACGGQVLLTRAMHDSARSNVRQHPALPDASAPVPPLKWVSHGPYVFKGVEGTVDVFEVGAEGLAPLSPPPDSEKAHRHVPPPGDPHSGPGATANPKRRWLNLALTGLAIALAVGWGAWSSFRRAEYEPIAQQQRRKIEQVVADARAVPPLLIGEHPADATYVEVLEETKNPAFQVIEDHFTVDMRGWKDVPPDKFGALHSAVTSSARRRLKKLSPADLYQTNYRTSGLEVFSRCLESFPYKVEIVRGDTFVGSQRMKARKLKMDVSSVPVGSEFQLRWVSTSWNSCQTVEEQWFGLVGYDKSVSSSMLLLFPPDRPFRSYSFTVAPTTKSPAVPYNGPLAVFAGPDRDWIYWEVPDPEADHVYRLNWKW